MPSRSNLIISACSNPAHAFSPPYPLSARLQSGCGPILSNLPQSLPEPRRFGRRLARIRPQRRKNQIYSTPGLVWGSVASLWQSVGIVEPYARQTARLASSSSSSGGTSDFNSSSFLTTDRSSNDRLSATVQFPVCSSVTTPASPSLIVLAGQYIRCPGELGCTFSQGRCLERRHG